MLIRASRHLKDYPVDMIIDLSLIPDEDLKANMRAWSDIIALHKKYKLDINYIFNSDNELYVRKAEEVLLDQVQRNILFTSKEKLEVKNKINKVHSEEGAVKSIIHIMKVDDLQNIDEFPENMFPVAMAEGHVTEGLPLRDFASAASIGLAQALCFKMKMENETILPIYVEREILPRMRKIYERLFPDDDINELITKETIMNMFSASSIVRKDLAITLALTPIVRMPVDQLENYHDRMHYLLQSA